MEGLGPHFLLASRLNPRRPKVFGTHTWYQGEGEGEGVE